MSRTVRLVGALLLAAATGAAVAVGQLWFAGRTGVLDWHACFCDAGGDDSFRFIVVFVTWLQATAVVAGAVLGWLALRRPNRPLSTLAALSAAAATGTLAGVPLLAAARAGAAATDTTSVVGHAIVGVGLGAAATVAALRSPRAVGSAMLCCVWLWAVGLASTLDSGGYTPALGMFYGGSGRFSGHADSANPALAVVETFGPAAGLAAIAAGVAWWGTRRAGRRSAGVLAALCGPALLFAAYLSVVPGHENAQPWTGAYSLVVLTVTAAAVGAVAGAWRHTRPHPIVDPLIVVSALGGAANEVIADLLPVSRHYRDSGLPLSLTALLLLLALPPIADLATSRRTDIAGAG